MILKATKSQESNILVKPKKTTSKDFVVIIDKMSKFTYFEGLKLINLLHLVDFSCWDQSSIFGLSRGKFWVQNLRGRDSPLHFKLT